MPVVSAKRRATVTAGSSGRAAARQCCVTRNVPLGGTLVGMAARGYTLDKDDYLKRLRRVEGQIRGLQRMVEDDTYCIDVLTQVAAATKALQSVAVGLLDEHVRHCVRNAVADGQGEQADEMVTEATRAIERLLRA